VNEGWEFATVATFQNCACWNIRFTKPFTESRKVLGIQGHFCKRIANICVEACRNQKQIRLESEEAVQCTSYGFDMLISRSMWGNRKIVYIAKGASTCARISWKLMD